MQILYFSWIRERVGIAEEQLTPPADVKTADQLMTWLTKRGEGYAAAFADPSQVRIAVNLEHVGPEQPVADADEVAFFPPVTGGCIG